jgi:Flp pilus assembly protein TadB
MLSLMTLKLKINPISNGCVSMTKLMRTLDEAFLWHVTPTVMMVPTVFWFFECLATTWIYFQSWSFILLVVGVKLPALCIKLRAKIAFEREAFLNDFSRFITELSLQTANGKSLKHAVENCLTDYQGVKGLMQHEIKCLHHYSILGIPIADGLDKMATRYGLEEAKDLAEQIDHSERFGHDLTETTRRASEWIGEQILHRRRQWRHQLERITEYRLLSKMPLAILGLLNMIYSDYLSALYSNLSGRLVMTMAVLILEISSWYFERMLSRSIYGKS